MKPTEGREQPSERRSGKRASPFVVLLVVACLVLIAVDLGLALNNRRLTARIDELTRIVHAAESSELSAGQPFPALTLLDPGGQPVSITRNDERAGTLLLVSQSSCDYCDDVAPIWEQAARTADGSSLQVLGLMLDATPDTLGEHVTSYPLVAPGGDSWALVRQLPGVPAALLVDGSGIVRQAFYGAEQAGLVNAVDGFLLER